MTRQVEVDHGGGRERIECSAHVGHGSSEDGCDNQARDAMGHVLHDEEWKEPICCANVCEHARGEEDIEPSADEQEERELHENDDAAGEQRNLRLHEIFGSKQTLHDKLVRTMAGHGKETAADEAAPKGIGLGE